MAKPRIFVSSTYYDLRHIRRGIEAFIEGNGYEAVLFESGDIPFSPELPLDQSCYKEIETCDILVLIIGGRYGTAASSESVAPRTPRDQKAYDFYNSITRKEFETAISLSKPAYIFVTGDVLAEYGTFKRNRNNPTIEFAHVESANVFKLLDSIYSLDRNNLTRAFENLDDITSWLRDQWAGTFADLLRRRSEALELRRLSQQLSHLENVTNILKEYSQRIIEGVSPDKSQSIQSELESKLKSQSAVAAVEKSSLGSHLVDTHKIDAEVVVQKVVTAKRLSELSLSLSQLTPGCAVVLNSTRRLARMSNEVREAWGLKPLLTDMPLEGESEPGKDESSEVAPSALAKPEEGLSDDAPRVTDSQHVGRDLRGRRKRSVAGDADQSKEHS